jgi:ATP-binding cassette subfamily B protein
MKNTEKIILKQDTLASRIPSSVVQFILYFIKKQPLRFIAILFISVIWALNESAFPYFIKHIVNTIQEFHGNRSDIYPLVMPFVIGLITLWVLMALTQRLQQIIAMYTIPKMRAQIRQHAYGYVRQHSHSYFMNHFAGDIANKIQAMPSSCENIVDIIIYSTIGMVALLIFSFILMWSADHFFASIMLLWVMCHASIVIMMMKKGNRLSKVHADAVSTLSGKIVDCISNIQNVKLFSRSSFERDYLNTYQESEIIKGRKFDWHSVTMQLVLAALSVIFVSSMVFGLVYQWVHYHISLGDFSLISLLMFSLLGMMWFMSFNLTRLAREAGIVRSALQLINAPHTIKDAPNAPIIRINMGKIAFKRVQFDYQNNTPLFNNLSVTINAGTKVGLVGFSGSGKSTFVNLIMRFYDISQGEILIDEQNIAAVQQHSLWEQIAMIPQDPSLFHRSLLENIRYGDIHASDDQVIAAAKAAHCHEFIGDLEQGYHTLVGERGVKLSGGQRQRIAIARGILKNAPILILDEATSSLDTITEKHIQQSLETLMKNCTTLVVAHRLSTLTNMDHILVFNQGEIIEEGHIKSLLANKGHFHQLWNMQQNGFLPE